MLTASIPAPPGNAIDIGPLTFHLYGLMIMLGVFAAVQVAEARWTRRGGIGGDITGIALWAVPGGLVGARIYHVITDPELFRGRWLHAFFIWEGGLGIPGGILGGLLVGIWAARRRRLPVLPLMDVVAPALPMAQAIGRLGNWFNQELFGRPSKLPWALEVDRPFRPAGYTQFATFQPTFAYELLWNLGVVAVVLIVERRCKLKPGRLFAVYILGYALGRLWVESLRIDHANHILGLRVNEWTSILAIVGSALVLWRGRGGGDDPTVAADPDGADGADVEPSLPPD